MSIVRFYWSCSYMRQGIFMPHGTENAPDTVFGIRGIKLIQGLSGASALGGSVLSVSEDLTSPSAGTSG